jgi:catechol 2,3-dioxygenase-like lactoylglutathione lyase family enzyme
MTHVARGIEHVGITVPDVEAAARFLIDAFGAEVLYDMPAPERAPDDPYPDEQARLGTRPGARWITTKVLRLGDGPGIELFEYADDEQRPPATPADLGLQHFSVYVDDIDAARELVVDAGGTALEGPLLLPGIESGDGNRWMYVVAPWGGIIELLTLPSPQRYEQETPLRKWRPAEGSER